MYSIIFGWVVGLYDIYIAWIAKGAGVCRVLICVTIMMLVVWYLLLLLRLTSTLLNATDATRAARTPCTPCTPLPSTQVRYHYCVSSQVRWVLIWAAAARMQCSSMALAIELWQLTVF